MNTKLTSVYYKNNESVLVTDSTPCELIEQTINFLKQNMDDAILKVVSGITIKCSLTEKTVMIIFHITRDQRAKFAKLVESLHELNTNIASAYIDFNKHYINIYGSSFIVDFLAGHKLRIEPVSRAFNGNVVKFLKKIIELTPKGKTKNAIMLDSFSGILPVHVAVFYNRLYCVDSNEHHMLLTKNNLSMNKINNCILSYDNAEQWLKFFLDGKFTPPGKKNWIGLFIANYDFINPKSLDYMFNINPESVIFYSENSEIAEINSLSQIFRSTYTTSINGIKIKKFMRKKDENI